MWGPKRKITSWTSGLAIAAGMLGALAPAAAQASTASVIDGVVIYTAAAGETNNVTVSGFPFSGEAVPPGVIIEDAGAPITPGPGCEATLEGVVCGTLAADKVIAYVLDGNDTVTDTRAFNDGVSFYGGTGADTLSSGPNEGGLQRLDGGVGNDVLRSGFAPVSITGGDGNDTITVNEAQATTIDSGAGNDSVAYNSFFTTFPPSIKLGAGNDTLTLGDDAIGGTLDTAYGSRSTFTYAPSRLSGGDGYDTLKVAYPFGFAFDLSACACGFGNIDRSAAPVSAPEGDILIGTDTANILVGSSGNDIIIPKGGADTVRGGSGDDRIVSSGDAVRDDIGCGFNKDIVDADLIDNAWGDCERRAPIVFGALHR